VESSCHARVGEFYAMVSNLSAMFIVSYCNSDSYSLQTSNWNPWPNFGRYSERNFGLKMTFRRIRRVDPNYLLSFITNLESNLQILRILERKWAICWREIPIFLANSESPCHRFQSG